jgi:hypothetical protein
MWNISFLRIQGSSSTWLSWTHSRMSVISHWCSSLKSWLLSDFGHLRHLSSWVLLWQLVGTLPKSAIQFPQRRILSGLVNYFLTCLEHCFCVRLPHRLHIREKFDSLEFLPMGQLLAPSLMSRFGEWRGSCAESDWLLTGVLLL